MVSLLKIIAAALIGVSTASGAYADWRYATWGMSPTALSQASRGEVEFMSSPGAMSCVFKGTTCLAFVQSVSVPPFTFQARFGFADDGKGGLNSVLLVTTPDQFWALDRALRGNYGEPVSMRDGFLANRIWRDVAGKNQVRLMDMNDQVIIEYTPIVDGL